MPTILHAHWKPALGINVDLARSKTREISGHTGSSTRHLLPQGSPHCLARLKPMRCNSPLGIAVESEPLDPRGPSQASIEDRQLQRSKTLATTAWGLRG